VLDPKKKGPAGRIWRNEHAKPVGEVRGGGGRGRCGVGNGGGKRRGLLLV